MSLSQPVLFLTLLGQETNQLGRLTFPCLLEKSALGWYSNFSRGCLRLHEDLIKQLKACFTTNQVVGKIIFQQLGRPIVEIGGEPERVYGPIQLRNREDQKPELCCGPTCNDRRTEARNIIVLACPTTIEHPRRAQAMHISLHQYGETRARQRSRPDKGRQREVSSSRLPTKKGGKEGSGSQMVGRGRIFREAHENNLIN